MSELGIATAASDKIVVAVIAHLNEGNIEDAVALFADQFSFKDHGIRLEFDTKDRLAEFFRKARELYPGSLLQTESIFMSGSNAFTEWTLQATLVEPACGNCRWKVPISLHGASVVRTENGRSQAGPTTMTVSSPGAPRWRHISQSGSNTEVFDYRCRELSKLTKEVTPMDRQFDPGKWNQTSLSHKVCNTFQPSHQPGRRPQAVSSTI